MLETVTEEQWREFEANGVVSLGVALEPGELASLSERLDALMLQKVDAPYDRSVYINHSEAKPAFNTKSLMA